MTVKLFQYKTDYYKDSDKDPQGLYASQAVLMKAKLDAVGATTETLVDYSSGHAVPQTTADLQRMYDFMAKHIASPINTSISNITNTATPSTDNTYNLMGMKVAPCYKGIVISSGRKVVVK